MNNHKGLKDRVIEFLMITATLFTITVLIGIKLKASIVLTVLLVGVGYITMLHVKNFFQIMSDNIEEIKSYIKEKNCLRKDKEVIKMDKMGKVSWLVIIWSIIIGLALLLLFKTLFNF